MGNWKKILTNLSRILTGLVFVFSGFVKGIDPLGTAYRLEDYFIAYGSMWAMPLALGLAVALCVIEFSIGAFLLLNLKMKYTSLALLVIMVFFTLLTFYDAIYEPVSDCGCFGDAITLTNWQTFYKNIVLMLPTLAVFFYRNSFRSPLGPALQYIGMLAVTFGFALFSVYNYDHLPIIDFMDWKVGKDMTPETTAETKVYLTYRNIASGETKEFLSPDYPWNDSVWMKSWSFVDQRTVSLGQKTDHGLLAEDEQGNDVTLSLIDSPEDVFIGIAYDLNDASKAGLLKLIQFEEAVRARGVECALLTSSLPEEVAAFKRKAGVDLPIYYADPIVLKTMVRANPGLVLFHSGVIVDKWHYRDIPEGKQLKALLDSRNHKTD
ncbi:MAG: DoxX family membrane protein [Bacteroidales bacterium]|nr:DoxX family membrane protein [Bacteroidales bacterium]